MSKKYTFNGQEFSSIKELRMAQARAGAMFGDQFDVQTIEDPVTDAEIQAMLTEIVQGYLDARAQELNYDNCNSVCTYVNTGVIKFDIEGEAFRRWRSAVWAKCYEMVAEYMSGQRSVPTTEELIAALPELVIDYSVIPSQE